MMYYATSSGPLVRRKTARRYRWMSMCVQPVSIIMSVGVKVLAPKRTECGTVRIILESEEEK